MRILHISAECYPAAKAGGLGDVVGALPKYLNRSGVSTAVVIPKYHTKWIVQQHFNTVFLGIIQIHNSVIPFSIEKEVHDILGFELYVANIPGKFDRPGVYMDENNQPYEDEVSRSISFQNAVLTWVLSLEETPKLLHCHDHHTGFIPFMVQHCKAYKALKDVPTVFTIHNGQYHGAFGWEKMYLLPSFDMDQRGLLDWSGGINPLATAIKCCWQLTTVSSSYLEELRHSSNGLEFLLRNESEKSVGILNGIDVQVWDPGTDHYLPTHLKRSVDRYKQANKKEILDRFRLHPELPLITFIGRLVAEKGADMIPDLVRLNMQSEPKAAFLVLGTGDPRLHHAFSIMREQYPGYFDAALEYNEGLAHTLYAGSDFLFMPSRVEPCGLNQMYAMRYGTVPIVRSVGGLKDTVVDMSEKDGSGFRFEHFNVHEAHVAVRKAVHFFHDEKAFKKLQKDIMKLDYSWERSAQEYEKIYNKLIKS